MASERGRGRGGRSGRALRRTPEGWIRVLFVERVPRVQKLRLRLKTRAGRARSITVAYARTKKALGRGKE